ncbi:MAG: site-2 protease family protein [Marinilabiliales bacterium]|nr:MAG: site-2 protease family protein [Marinilabiliales bacterium]
MQSRFSLKLGKPFGIKVSIHWTFSLLIAWIVFISVNRGLEFGQIMMHILFILAIFGCVLLHELGHSLAAIKLGGKVQSITLLPIGGMASISEMPEKPRDEFLISAAGPLVNVVIAGLIWFYLSVISPIDMGEITYEVITPGNFLVMLLTANLFIVAFNLIPAFPMDGGRLFRSALSIRMSKLKATRIAKDIGQIFAIMFIITGFFHNPFLIIIGFFILLGAKGEYEMMKYRDILNNYTVRDVIKKDYEELDENDNLATAAEKFAHTSPRGFVVTSGGKYAGILTRNDLIRGLNTNGKEGRVGDLAGGTEEDIDTDMVLFDAFKKMQMKKLDIVPVTEKGKFAGIIELEGINEFFLIRNAIR